MSDTTRQDQIVFIHILKTAGQSVMQLIEANYKESERLFANRDKIATISPADLQQYKIIYGHNLYLIHEYLGYKPQFFTFLRDPVERTLSHYAYLRRATYMKIVHSQTLEEFITDPRTRPQIFNYQTRWIASDSMMRAAEPDSEGLLELAKQRLDEFAVVGIVEEFEKSIQTLSKVFKWRKKPELEKRNVGANKVTTGDLPAQTLQLILDATRMDNELYKYGLEHLNRLYDNLNSKKGFLEIFRGMR